MMRTAMIRALVGACVMTSSMLSAQEQPKHVAGGNEGKLPIGWKIRTDAGTDMHGGKDTMSFVQMTPGYHVTTGPAAIMWSPDSTASGSFIVDGSIFLFPTRGRDQEGYGIFVGGQALDGASPRYTYFLLRNDGKFLIKQRAGTATPVLKDWTPHAAIKLQAGEDAMKNDLRIVSGAQSVAFLVNGTEVASLPRATVAPDGAFGLRFNHAVNAHVVKVTRAAAAR